MKLFVGKDLSLRVECVGWQRNLGICAAGDAQPAECGLCSTGLVREDLAEEFLGPL